MEHRVLKVYKEVTKMTDAEIRGYFDEFKTLAGIYNEKRLRNQNKLVLEGWLNHPADTTGRLNLMTPWDMFVSREVSTGGGCEVVLDFLRRDVLRIPEHIGVLADLFIRQIHGATPTIIAGDEDGAGVDLSVDATVAFQTDEFALFVPDDIGVVIKRIGAFDPPAHGLLERFQSIRDHHFIGFLMRFDDQHAVAVDGVDLGSIEILQLLETECVAIKMATSFNLYDVGDRQGVTVVAYGLAEIEDSEDIFQVLCVHIAVKDGLVDAGIDLTRTTHSRFIVTEKDAIPIQIRVDLIYLDFHHTSPSSIYV